MFGDFMETSGVRLESSKERRRGEERSPRDRQWLDHTGLHQLPGEICFHLKKNKN